MELGALRLNHIRHISTYKNNVRLMRSSMPYMVQKTIVFLALLINWNCTSPSDNTETQTPAPMDVKVFFSHKCSLGEGAIWNAKTQELIFIDIEEKQLFFLPPSGKSPKVYDLPERVGTVVPTHDDDKVIVALANGIFEFSRKGEKLNLLSNPHPNQPQLRMNDGKCDPQGRLWVGSMHLEQIKGAAKLYKINHDRSFEQMIDSVTISNGIVWSLDGSKMYYIDTPTGEVAQYDYDVKTGIISNRKTAIKIPESMGYPDGSTIDAEGMIWIALWNGNCVSRWNPNTGKLLQKVEVPAHNVTSCAFGGKDLDTLFITSSRLDMTEEESERFPEAGSLFSVKVGVKGIESIPFGK